MFCCLKLTCPGTLKHCKTFIPGLSIVCVRLFSNMCAA